MRRDETGCYFQAKIPVHTKILMHLLENDLIRIVKFGINAGSTGILAVDIITWCNV